MPDCVAGATPVAFGNWKSAFTIVNRKSDRAILWN